MEDKSIALVQFKMMSNDDRIARLDEIVKKEFFSSAIYSWNIPEVEKYEYFEDWLNDVDVSRIFNRTEVVNKLLKYASSDDIKFYFYKEFRDYFTEKLGAYLSTHPNNDEEDIK